MKYYQWYELEEGADLVNSYVKIPYLYQEMKILELRTNMRVHLQNENDVASFKNKN